jgi:hypothetical protein
VTLNPGDSTTLSLTLPAPVVGHYHFEGIGGSEAGGTVVYARTVVQSTP